MPTTRSFVFGAAVAALCAGCGDAAAPSEPPAAASGAGPAASLFEEPAK